MEIDITAFIKGTKRLIETRDHQGKPARVLTTSRTYGTDRDDLWDALTNPARIPNWFMPVSGDLGVGGRFQVEGNASGQVLSCKPGEEFQITWEMGPEVSWVTVQLSKTENGTLLQLEHIAHVPEEMWNQFGPGAVGVGWDLSLLGLDRHLTTGATKNPEQVAGWTASEEGVGFVSLSSEAWADASIADGTDEAIARQGQAATTAFYTGTQDCSDVR
jgi:uncharacterized protein YndB with AHSA1/START domain